MHYTLGALLHIQAVDEPIRSVYTMPWMRSNPLSIEGALKPAEIGSGNACSVPSICKSTLRTVYFTSGHCYLIKSLCSMWRYYIFVLEEDASYFSF